MLYLSSIVTAPTSTPPGEEAEILGVGDSGNDYALSNAMESRRMRAASRVGELDQPWWAPRQLQLHERVITEQQEQ